MTNEEAIKILEYPVKKWSMEWDEREDGLSYYEALDMAISALREQEHFRDFTKKVETLTNAQKIRAMSDEEVGVWICKHALSCGCCVGAELCNRDDGIGNGAVKWRQQPAEEDDNA